MLFLTLQVIKKVMSSTENLLALSRCSSIGEQVFLTDEHVIKYIVTYNDDQWNFNI